MIVTLYPQRRSARALKQGLQLPGVIRKLFNGTEKPHVLYHDIIKNTMQHESSITIHGESMKYLEVFSREVLRLVSVSNSNIPPPCSSCVQDQN